jgi:hypothetical protein
MEKKMITFIRSRILKINNEVAWLQREDGTFLSPLLPCNFIVRFEDLIPDEL